MGLHDGRIVGRSTVELNQINQFYQSWLRMPDLSAWPSSAVPMRRKGLEPWTRSLADGL